MVPEIAFVGTENYYDNYWGTDGPENGLYYLQAWVADLWDDKIGKQATFEVYLDGEVEVPESAISDTGFYPDRWTGSNTIPEWLESNWSKHPNQDIDSKIAAIVVADYYSQDDDVHGYTAGLGTAGLSQSISGGVNMWFEDNGELPYHLQEVESNGIAAHELFNVWGAKDDDDAAIETAYESEPEPDASIMFDPSQQADCGNIIDDTPDQVIRWVSSCTESAVKDTYNSQI